MTELTEADFEALCNDTHKDRREDAQALYTAYREAVGRTAYNGEKIPEWANIRWRAKWGWLNVVLRAEQIL